MAGRDGRFGNTITLSEVARTRGERSSTHGWTSAARSELIPVAATPCKPFRKSWHCHCRYRTLHRIREDPCSHEPPYDWACSLLFSSQPGAAMPSGPRAPIRQWLPQSSRSTLPPLVLGGLTSRRMIFGSACALSRRRNVAEKWSRSFDACRDSESPPGRRRSQELQSVIVPRANRSPRFPAAFRIPIERWTGWFDSLFPSA